MQPGLPPEYINVPSIIAFNKAIPPEIRDTWVWLRGLCWNADKHELEQTTPPVISQELADIIGKSRQTLYGHMAFLRDRGALRWAAAEDSGVYVEFPVSGQLFMDAPKVSEILDTHYINNIESIKLINNNIEPVQNSGHTQKGRNARASHHKTLETVPAEVLKPVVDALAHVCRLDKKLNYPRLAKESKALHLAGYTATQIMLAFGPGKAWYLKDWRGQKGQAPTPADVRSKIYEYTTADIGTLAVQNTEDLRERAKRMVAEARAKQATQAGG